MLYLWFAMLWIVSVVCSSSHATCMLITTHIVTLIVDRFIKSVSHM